MKSNNSPSNLSPRGAMFLFRNQAMVIALGLCGSVGTMAVHAQATAGSVFGWAPVGETISATGTTTGIHRLVDVDARGHYSFNRLPIGTYSVTLEKDGQAIETHPSVSVAAGRGQQVDFTCEGEKCKAVGN